MPDERYNAWMWLLDLYLMLARGMRTGTICEAGIDWLKGQINELEIYLGVRWAEC